MSERLRIALLIESSRGYGRALLRGIAAYARGQGSWSFFFEERSLVDRIPPKLKQWRPDGIIARVNGAAFARQLDRLDVPVVSMLHEKWGRQFPEVVPDQQEVVRLAVEHLLERGLRNLGFCGFPRIRWSVGRERLFVDYVSGRGLRPHVLRHQHYRPQPSYCTTRTEARQHVQELAKWLSNLPKPVGLLACNDERAHQVLTVCNEIGLKVPDQVAVIGVDNDRLLCELTDPTLSSVDPGSERIGWQAAKLLHEMLLGRRDPPAMTLVPPAGIVARRSTDVVAVPHADANDIACYIRQHSCEGLKVEHLLEEFSISRSTLERWFCKHVGHSASVEIARVRVRRAEELLATTDLTLREIAERLGFSHLETLHHAFKRWTGQTPGEYRRRIGFPVDGPQASQHSTVRELRAVTAPKLLVARDDEEE